MNDFSVQPVKEHLLELAETRLRNHPGMFQMLKHKLATGSPRALMILDCLVPGEWVYALKVSRNFSSIDAKLIRAIDSWVNSRPTSKTVVVSLPAPYLPAGEPLTEVSDTPAQAQAMSSAFVVTTHSTKAKELDHIGQHLKKIVKNLEHITVDAVMVEFWELAMAGVPPFTGGISKDDSNKKQPKGSLLYVNGTNVIGLKKRNIRERLVRLNSKK